MGYSAREIAEALHSKGKPSGPTKKGGWMTQCIGHKDKNPSMEVWDHPGHEGWVGFRCYAGCDWQDLRQKMIAAGYVDPPTPKKVGKWLAKLIEEHGDVVSSGRYWYYVDENRQQTLRVERFDFEDGDKQFVQSQPDPSHWSGWKAGTAKWRPIVYNLPQVVEYRQSGRVIFWVEGEKCADRLIAAGLCASTNRGGCKNPLSKEEVFQLKGAAAVVVISDNDEPGWKRTQENAADFARAGIPTLVLELPDLGPRLPNHGLDIYDWLEKGHTIEELEELVAAKFDDDGKLLDAFVPPPEEEQPAKPKKEKSMKPLAEHNPFSEVTAAQRFLERYGTDLRYSLTRKDPWSVWNGKCWEPSGKHHAEMLVEKLMLDYARELRNMPIDVDKYHKWLDRSQSRSFLNNVLALTGKYCSFPDTKYDSDPDLVCVRNGVIDLKTRSLLTPHKREYNCSKVIDIDYDPKAECPRFEEFLLTIFRANYWVIGFIKRMLGYMLSGRTSERAFFFSYGASGSNGKSTLKEIALRVMGPYARAISKQLIMAGGFETKAGNPIQLLGRRLVVIDEVGRKDKIDEGQLKQVTGQDTLPGSFLYNETIDFRSNSKVWMIGNERPYLEGSSNDPVWERILLIEHAIKIPDSQKEKDLTDKLFNAEAQGILRLIVDGAYELINGTPAKPEIGMPALPPGLNPPGEVIDSRTSWRNENDPIKQFVDERCKTGAGCTSVGRDLFVAFNVFMRDNGSKPRGYNWFCKEMNARYKRLDKPEDKEPSRYGGVELRPDYAVIGKLPGVGNPSNLFLSDN